MQSRKTIEKQTASSATSEKINPEIAKCYDEIDQIYDYIRGLAPLPVQLRKIKSIDFEQLEREKRNQQQQQQQLQLQAKKQLFNQRTPALQPVVSRQMSLVAPKTAAKARQRDASDNEELPNPEPTLKQQQRVQGPLPIKVTQYENRPTVKRVESLNLGGDLRMQMASSNKPTFMISGPQRGQLFRLPRAHSTSTLNKPGAKATSVSAPKQQTTKPSQTVLNGSQRLAEQSARRQSNESKGSLFPSNAKSVVARTLPALRLTQRLNSSHQQQPSFTLNRLSDSPRNRDRQLNSARKSLDLVETFVDDDDAPSAATSSSEGSRGRLKQTARERPASESSSDGSRTSSSCSVACSSESSSDPSSGREDSEASSTSDQETTSEQEAEVRSKKISHNRKGSGDRWVSEKSHSDYEHDTVSLTSNSASPNADQLCDSSSSRKPKRVGAGQRSSSSADTGNEIQGSHLTSSSGRLTNSPKLRLKRPSKEGNEERYNARDHIYEQIPAHRARTQNVPGTQRVQPQNEKSYSQLRQQRSQEQAPFNYPVAYAPSTVVAPKLQQQVAFLSQTKRNGVQRTQHALKPQLQPHERAGCISTYPTALVPMRHTGYYPMAATLAHSSQQRQQHRPLEQRHRQLSMGNLHMLPYLNHPLASLYKQPTPFSKQLETATAGLNRSSSSSKVNRSRAPRLSPAQLITQIQMPRAVNKRQRQPPEFITPAVSPGQRLELTDEAVLRWPPQVTSSEQQRERELGQHSPRARLDQRPNTKPSAKEKRNSIRRLTAIGIEQALESVRFARESCPTPKSASRQSPLPDARKALGLFNAAPLIDGSESEEGSGAQVRDDAHKTLPSRCLNSVSDLQSFSSNSDDGDEEDADETENERKSRAHSSSSDSTQRPAATESGNFVSSRSFIKCYYGRDKIEDESRLARLEGQADEGKNRKSSGEKLLGLIGLNPNKLKGGDKKTKAHKKSGSMEEDPRQVSAGDTSFPVQRVGDNQLFGEFLSSEGPILVRDRRIAALRSELVRHYEHPTVQVASVSSSNGQKREKSGRTTELTRSSNASDSASSYEAAIKNSGTLLAEHKRQQAPRECSQPKIAPRSTKRVPAAGGATRWAVGKSAPTAMSNGAPSSGLIKVPKLSKQSHLLNRPLPKPPQQPNPNASSLHRRLTTIPAASASGAKLQTATNNVVASRPPAVMAKRRLLVSTNLDASASPPLDRLDQRSVKPLPTKSKQPSAGSSSLSPSLALNTQPSPTVTTYTSSGISSRLTSGTHLANTTGASSSAGSSGRVKSLSELHKQSKLLKQQQHQNVSADSDGRLSSAVEQRRNEEAAVGGDALPIGEEKENGKQVRVDSEPERETTMTDNLRLFDEKFSSKFVDKQLASSDDSLLESINFSGTLNRRARRLNAES